MKRGCPRSPVTVMATSAEGSSTGSGRNTTAFARLMRAVFAPIVKHSVHRTAALKPGDPRADLIACRKSCQSASSMRDAHYGPNSWRSSIVFQELRLLLRRIFRRIPRSAACAPSGSVMRKLKQRMDSWAVARGVLWCSQEDTTVVLSLSTDRYHSFDGPASRIWQHF